MSKAKTRLATAAIGGMLVAGGTGMVAFAPAAHAADPVKVNMTCKIPYPPGAPDVTDDFNITLEMPTTKTAPGGEATVKVKMGATPVKGPETLKDPVPFNATFDAKASGGSTQDLKIVGEPGKVQVTKGEPITLPDFDAKIKVPADATGDIDITPTKLLLKAVVDVPCAVNGTPKLGKILVDKNATAPPTTTPPTDEPPGPPNGREVNVKYACKTFESPVTIPDTTPTFGITVKVASTAKKGDNLDISASFKDNVVGSVPAGIPAAHIKYTPKLTIDVVQGDNKRTVDVVGAAKEADPQPGDPLKVDGPLTGKFSVWGGGDFSFSPGALRIDTHAKFGALEIDTYTDCKVTSTDVSATLKAKGDAGSPPPPSLTQSPSGSANSNGGTTTTGGATGDLAHTGASGGGMTAFAMAAGTAVLGAIALMLFVPYRRRIRNQV
ncbi:hypothetical protein [Embleya sp. NPDC005575]|uniref:hypothetical protein n=1 Tax=Embleya sp. NPDC005575 TaxID=3156892 RepID=UPI0033BB8223